MPHILNYAGRYFRVEIADIVKPDASDKVSFVAWCSEAFSDLQDMPNHACSRLIPGPLLATEADALRTAGEWIKADLAAQQTKRPSKLGRAASVFYTAWLFKGGNSFGFDFKEFSDAKLFAAAAEKSSDITKVGIKNNESPEFLTVWEKH